MLWFFLCFSVGEKNRGDSDKGHNKLFQKMIKRRCFPSTGWHKGIPQLCWDVSMQPVNPTARDQNSFIHQFVTGNPNCFLHGQTLPPHLFICYLPTIMIPPPNRDWMGNSVIIFSANTQFARHSYLIPPHLLPKFAAAAQMLRNKAAPNWA